MNRLLLAGAGVALVGLGMALLVLLGWRPPAGDGGAAVTEVRYSQEPRMSWDAGVDVLDLHEQPDADGDVIASLHGRPTGVESSGRIALVDGVLWRELTLPDGVTGWTDARLLIQPEAR